MLFCHPAPELSPVFLTKPGSDCRGTEEKQGFSHFLEKVVVENRFLKALARDHVAGKVCKESKWLECRNSGLFSRHAYMLVASRGTDLCSTKHNMISEEQADRKGSLFQA